MHDLDFRVLGTTPHWAVGCERDLTTSGLFHIWINAMYLFPCRWCVGGFPTLMPQNQWIHEIGLGYRMGLDNFQTQTFHVQKAKKFASPPSHKVSCSMRQSLRPIRKLHQILPKDTKRMYKQKLDTSLLWDASPPSKSPPGCTRMITFVVSCNPELGLHFPLPSRGWGSHSKVNWLISSQSPGFVHRTWNCFESHSFACLDPWTKGWPLYGIAFLYKMEYQIYHKTGR